MRLVKIGQFASFGPAFRAPHSMDSVVMKRWFFRISEDEIDAAVLHLIDHHGLEGARDEALRLSDVGRRIGSMKNSAIFLRAAQRIAVKRGLPMDDVQPPRSRFEAFAAFIADFGAPRIPFDEFAHKTDEPDVHLIDRSYRIDGEGGAAAGSSSCAGA